MEKKETAETMGLSLKANTTMQTKQQVSISPFPKFPWIELVPLNFNKKQTSKQTQKKKKPPEKYYQILDKYESNS